MIFIASLFLVAVAIAAVAAYFSITGLVAVFSASAIAIIIMGSVLEVGKLMAISYSYRYWNLIGFIQKTALLFFVVLLMAITSIGIFGFLSKAHLEKVGPQDQYLLEIQRIEQKISLEQEQIMRGQKVLNNLDAALDKYIELGYVTRGLEQREEQAEQRQQIEQMISESESQIDSLNEELLEKKSVIQEIELEVGPIKYIAELFYGDAENAIDKAVKILIIMLVCTFDPLAVMLLISANHAFLNRGNDKVRSEFSILENNEKAVQDDKLLYDDLSDEEKDIHIQKVREYITSLDEQDESEASKETEDKYRNMVNGNDDSDNNHADSEQESPYKLNKIQKPKKRNFSWLPRKK